MNITRICREPLSPVDNAWFRIGTPTNLAMISGVITFSEPLDFERLTATIEVRLLSYQRFGQVVREPKIGPAFWETDPGFNIQNHVYKISMPEPRDHLALQRLVSEMMSIPLDKAKPLWELHYVDNYIEGGALICRLHHCIADGVALIQVLLSAADLEPDVNWPALREEPYPGLSPLARLFVPAVKAARMFQSNWRGARRLLHGRGESLIDVDKVLGFARKGADGGLALGKLLLMLPDRKTFLKGQCGIPKKAVWSKAIKVSDVKVLGKQMGGTINDILLAAMTGALRRYMLDRGEDVDGLNIRVLVPVDLRAEDEIDQLGNRFGLVFLSLPIGIEDPVKRLSVLKKRMDTIKNTPEAVVAFGILSFMGINPRRIENIIRDIFALKVTAVATNVPGPRQPLYMAGGLIDGLMFWVPMSANLSLGMSIISYAEDVIVGVATDAGIIPDPEKIVVAFQDEFENLRDYGLALDTNGATPAITTYKQDTGVARDALPDVGADEGTVSQAASNAAARPDVPTEESQAVPGKCQALTKKGQPCKNRALSGSSYCRVHSRQPVE